MSELCPMYFEHLFLVFYPVTLISVSVTTTNITLFCDYCSYVVTKYQMKKFVLLSKFFHNCFSHSMSFLFHVNLIINLSACAERHCDFNRNYITSINQLGKNWQVSCVECLPIYFAFFLFLWALCNFQDTEIVQVFIKFCLNCVSCGEIVVFYISLFICSFLVHRSIMNFSLSILCLEILLNSIIHRFFCKYNHGICK